MWVSEDRVLFAAAFISSGHHNQGGALNHLEQSLDVLESFHGPQTVRWPTDPYEFLVWWHCGYPASEARCQHGWQALNAAIGISPEKFLVAKPAQLARALKSGGMVPELRGARLREIAERVRDACDGDLPTKLRRLPLSKARTLLKGFPGIGDPGADRILLFGGIAALAAVPSNCPEVLVRIRVGKPHANYSANYRDAQQLMQRELAEDFTLRTRAYLLLQQHGQQICKRTHPKCGACPLQDSCAFFAQETGRAST